MLTEIQREVTEFLKSEANAAMVRACRGDATANANIAEAQELLALRARIIARQTPPANVAQLELPLLKIAA